MSITARYALRSLARHKRRTILSIIGIGLGCGVCLFVVSFVRGEGEMIMRAAAESGAGHLRIVPEGWSQTRANDLRLTDWEAMLRRARNTPGVVVATPRTRTEGLLAFGTRLTGVEIVGVDPTTEQQANRLVRNVVEGVYLSPGDMGKAVVGHAFLKRLRVELGDPLMVTVAGADGEMRSAMLTIAGVVETGSRDLDATVCQVTLAQAEDLSGIPGAGEITLLVDNPRHIPRIKAALDSALPAGDSVVAWDEIFPELASGVEVDKTFSRLTVGIIVTVVFLGIASAQLAAVLERRREFAVLSALGMKGLRLVRVMLIEGLVLGMLGTLAGLLTGVPSAYWLARWGIDFSAFYGQDAPTLSNILVDPVLYGDFGWWLVPLATGIAMTATLLSSLYPAWYAAKTDPARALRVDG